MITSFIAGLVIGLFLSWLKLRKITMRLKRSTEGLREATIQEKALSARLNAANAALAILAQQKKVDEEGDLQWMEESLQLEYTSS
jgi:hypothetical protein